MALHPFYAYLLPILVLVIGEMAFIFLSCRKQRPRLERNEVVKKCWLITIAFAIMNIFITADRTEVWVVESENNYSHKYLIKRTGMYERIGHGDYYIMNNSTQPVYYAELHYNITLWHTPNYLPSNSIPSSSHDVIKCIDPGTILAIKNDLDGVFKTPPERIRVKRGESSIRYYLLNARQTQDL